MEKKEKVKKPFYKKWWFWVIIVVLILAALGSGSSEDAQSGDDPPPSTMQSSDPEQGSTQEPSDDTTEITEADKETAKELDAEILGICTKAEAEYNDFNTLISTEGVTPLDAYNKGKEVVDNLKDYHYTQLAAVTGSDLEEFDKYKETAKLYIFLMTEAVEAAMVYLDDPKTSNLSEYQSAVEAVSPYAVSLVADRFAFLSASGLSDEEITALTPSE